MLERKLNGRELMLAGRFDEALQAFQQEMTMTKLPFHSFMGRGLLYRHLNKVDAAIADFSAAINSPMIHGEPYAGYWDAYYYRGNAYLAQRDFARADADHQRYRDLITEQCQKLFTEHRQLLQRYNIPLTPPQPDTYLPLGRSFNAAQDCQLALTDHEAAIANGHGTPAVYFCMGAAYECLRDYFRAIDCYHKIGAADGFAEAVKIAAERSQAAALYVEPKDKRLIQPGIEYLTIHGDMEADSFTCYYFDLDGEREEEVKGIPKPSSDWKQVASRSMREVYYAYYQRRK